MRFSIPPDDEHQTTSGGCKRRRQQALSLIAELQDGPGEGSKQTVFQCAPLQPGDRLGLSDQPADAAFVVRRGLVKRIWQSSPSASQVCGFYDEGSIVDFSSQISSDWTEGFVAIERSWLCRLRPRFLPMATRKRFAALVSAQLGKEHDFQLKLLDWSAEQKVAAFLLRLNRHSHTEHLRRSISDGDIASYLGIDEPGLKGVLRRFLARGWIEMSGDEIHLLDRHALLRLSSS